MRVWRTIKIR